MLPILLCSVWPFEPLSDPFFSAEKPGVTAKARMKAAVMIWIIILVVVINIVAITLVVRRKDNVEIVYFMLIICLSLSLILPWIVLLICKWQPEWCEKTLLPMKQKKG